MKFNLTELPDVKRFYMPGVKVSCKCINCNTEMHRDFGDQYMAHPQIGNNTQGWWCEDCDTEYEIDYKLSVTVELEQIGEQRNNNERNRGLI